MKATELLVITLFNFILLGVGRGGCSNDFVPSKLPIKKSVAFSVKTLSLVCCFKSVLAKNIFKLILGAIREGLKQELVGGIVKLYDYY